ncbi:hypothetical protein HDV06_005622, partial [Boothiomyces sp. JEL0866]
MKSDRYTPLAETPLRSATARSPTSPRTIRPSKRIIKSLLQLSLVLFIIWQLVQLYHSFDGGPVLKKQLKAGSCGKKAEKHFATIYKNYSDFIYSDQRISSTGFNKIAEISADEVKEYSSCLQPLTIVHVSDYQLIEFLDKVVPSIRVPIIVLSTGTRNLNVVAKSFSHFVTGSNPKIAHWYAQNCQTKYDWLTCLPMGISERHLLDFEEYASFNYKTMNPVEGGIPQWKPMRNSLLVNFAQNVGNKEMFEYFCKNLEPLSNCGNKQISHDFSYVKYFDLIRNSRFVVLPPSHMDSNLVYETLILGAFPIVQSSLFDDVYRDLPVLTYKKFTEITHEVLELKYREFRKNEFNYGKLYSYYWQNLMYSKRVDLGGSESAFQYGKTAKLQKQEIVIPQSKPEAFIEGTCGTKIKQYYPTVLPKPEDLSFEDRISQIGMKHMAELTYSNMPTPEQFKNPLEEVIGCLHPYTVIYVDAWRTQEFIDKALPQIKVPVIVMSGDGDTSNPSFDIKKYLDGLSGKPTRPPMIAHWFAQHCRPDAKEYDWVTCIPLGLNQWLDTRENYHSYAKDHGHLMNRLEGGKPHWKPAEKSVVANFRISTNPGQRQPAWDYFCGEEFAKTGGSSFCFYKSVDKNFTFVDIFDIIANARFVVSPAGSAIDCYRTYEALFLGSYPIVRSSQLDVLFQDLPVLIVDDFKQVTAELLEETYHRFRIFIYQRESQQIPKITNQLVHNVEEIMKPIEQAIYPTKPISPMEIPLAKTTCAKKSLKWVYPTELVPGNIRMEDRFSQI